MNITILKDKEVMVGFTCASSTDNSREELDSRREREINNTPHHTHLARQHVTSAFGHRAHALARHRAAELAQRKYCRDTEKEEEEGK
jgi:hypothetical protein